MDTVTQKDIQNLKEDIGEMFQEQAKFIIERFDEVGKMFDENRMQHEKMMKSNREDHAKIFGKITDHEKHIIKLEEAVVTT